MGKLRNLDKEYRSIKEIYSQQKEYRKTVEGKKALAKANKKYRDNQRIAEVKTHPALNRCHCCNENIIEFLSVKNNKIVCFNCKNQVECPHQKEVKQICQ